MDEPRQTMTSSIPSSPGSSSLPSPPSSPQHRAHNLSHHHATTQGHVHQQQQRNGDGTFESLPGSPLSIASSFPSGASSYVFSHSASSSPPHLARGYGGGPLSDYNHSSRHQTDSETDPLGLVIPSLTLPPPINSAEGRHSDSGRSRHHRSHRHHVSPYGETLGNLELFIFGRKGAGKTAIANTLVDGNDDVVSVVGWDNGTLVASTNWKDERGRHGSRNVRIIEVEGFEDDDDQAPEVLQPLLRTIHERFEKVAAGLSSELPASQPVMDMLASSSSSLPTALIFLLSSPPTQLELTLLSLISSQIPTITLPPYPPSISSAASFASMPLHGLESTSTILLGPKTQSPSIPSATAAPFRPRNTLELRSGLFRNPAILKGLRVAAAERFAHWREIRQACGNLEMSSFPVAGPTKAKEEKAKARSVERDRRKKLEWELRLSRDVAVAFNAAATASGDLASRGRSETIKPEPDQSVTLDQLEEGRDRHVVSDIKEEDKEQFEDALSFHEDGRPFLSNDGLGDPDPLHLPTLFRLSAALLGAFGKRLVSSLVEKDRPMKDYYAQGEKRVIHGDDEYEDEGWSLTKWGIAGIAFAIGYCAGRLMK